MEEKEPRIPFGAKLLMLGTAGLFDFAQATLNTIPIAGTMLAFMVVAMSFLTFFVWFKIHDVGFLERFGAKKVVAYIVAPALELLSAGIAPGITVAVWITISIVAFEDALIEKGIVSREDLRKLEKTVKLGSAKGFSSGEFKEALSTNLHDRVTREIEPSAGSLREVEDAEEAPQKAERRPRMDPYDLRRRYQEMEVSKENNFRKKESSEYKKAA